MRVLLRMAASLVFYVALIARIWYQPFGTICSDGPGDGKSLNTAGLNHASGNLRLVDYTNEMVPYM